MAVWLNGYELIWVMSFLSVVGTSVVGVLRTGEVRCESGAVPQRCEGVKPLSPNARNHDEDGTSFTDEHRWAEAQRTGCGL